MLMHRISVHLIKPKSKHIMHEPNCLSLNIGRFYWAITCTLISFRTRQLYFAVLINVLLNFSLANGIGNL